MAEEYSQRQRDFHTVIFEADTAAGKWFDIVLILAILLSIVMVSLESVDSLSAKYHNFFVATEWVLTIFFTIEYILRLYAVRKAITYAKSFYGIIDLISILPTYLSLLLPGSETFMVVRALRLLRIFRVFKLVGFLHQGKVIIDALKQSREKIFVFMTFILLLVTILGSFMYLIEGHSDSGFSSIPVSIYWAIVTLTTVGYGDIAPVTAFGQAIAAFIMLLGYSVIAVPTGIVTSELVRKKKSEVTTQVCPSCGAEGHDADAKFCNQCGASLND